MRPKGLIYSYQTSFVYLLKPNENSKINIFSLPDREWRLSSRGISKNNNNWRYGLVQPYDKINKKKPFLAVFDKN